MREKQVSFLTICAVRLKYSTKFMFFHIFFYIAVLLGPQNVNITTLEV